MRRDIVTDESGMATVEGFRYRHHRGGADRLGGRGVGDHRADPLHRRRPGGGRLTAAGDPSAVSVGRQVAGAAAAVDVSESAELIEATVSTAVRLLPGLRVSARAVAVPEPDGLGQVRFASG